MAVKLPHSPMLLHGIITAFSEKLNYESKALEGYSATVLGADGGAAKVNFSLDSALPFAPALSQVIWFVTPGEYDVEGSKGMSTKFLRQADEADLLNLHAVLEDNEKRHPVKAA